MNEQQAPLTYTRYFTARYIRNLSPEKLKKQFPDSEELEKRYQEDLAKSEDDAQEVKL